MHKTVLHIGSNLGDASVHLATCVQMIEGQIGRIETASKIYRTQAWGVTDQDDFLNQGLLVSTIFTAEELLVNCQRIEEELGRKRTTRWGPRIIDIDIIFYDDVIFNRDDLHIPHPRMHERNFVLFPLAEIIPAWEHPILSQSIAQLKEQSLDSQLIKEIL